MSELTQKDINDMALSDYSVTMLEVDGNGPSATLSASDPSTKPSLRLLTAVNALTYLLCLVSNANQSNYSQYSPADIAALYPTPFNPAGWAFSIWGIIYSFLLGFVIWQLLVAFGPFTSREDSEISSGVNAVNQGTVAGCGSCGCLRRAGRKLDSVFVDLHCRDADEIGGAKKSERRLQVERLLRDQIGWLFAITNLFNAIWLPIFNQGTTVTVGISAPLLLFGLVLPLSLIEIRTGGLWWRAIESTVNAINSNQSNTNTVPMRPIIDSVNPAGQQLNSIELQGLVKSRNLSKPTPGYELFLVDFPFSLYLGWTTVATILNISIFSVATDWRGNQEYGADFWATMLLYIASLIFLTLVLKAPGLWSPSLWHGNFMSGFVFVWAALAIRSNLKGSTGTPSPCRSGLIKYIEVPVGCDRVAVVADITACIVGACSMAMMVKFCVKYCGSSKA